MKGAGLAGSEASQIGTQLAVGALILLLGGLSPWLAIRTCTFVGDSLYATHLQAGQATTGARLALAAPQKVAYLRSGMAASVGAGRSAAAATTRAGGSGGDASGSNGSGGTSTGPTLRPPGKDSSGSRPLAVIPGAPGTSGNGSASESSTSREVNGPGGSEPKITAAPAPEAARPTPPVPQPQRQQPDFSKLRKDDR